MHFDGITIVQLAEAINVDYNTIESWINYYNFPVKIKLFSISQRTKVVYYKDLWKWLENYKYVVDVLRIEPNILGPEPEWFKEKRNADLIGKKNRMKAWTEEDELLLRSLVNAHQYTYPEIAVRLKHTEAAIKPRLSDVGIKIRPVRLGNHTKYTKEEAKQIVELYDKGYSIDSIAEKIGKSALGVRGKLERMGYRFKGGILIHLETTVV